MISARRAPTPSPHRARASSYDFNTHPSDHRSRVPPRARVRARSRARLPKNFHYPPFAHNTTTARRPTPDRTSRSVAAREGKLISIVSRARPASHARARSPATPRARLSRRSSRDRALRARGVPARRRERTRARAHLIKIEPARGARSRDEALARRRPGRRRGDQAVRTRRDATTMRSRVDASARRARARRDDDARRGIRDEIGAEFSCRLRRDDGRPTDDRGRRARREDDDDARGDACAMTDDARAIADGRQAGSGGRER